MAFLSFFYHTEDLTWGQKRRTQSLLTGYSCTPYFPKPSRPSPTSPKTGLRCLPLKSRTGSNRISAFNRAAVLSQGPLEELQDRDLGQTVWEEWELGTFIVRCRAAGLLMSPWTDATEGRGLRWCSALGATSGAYWLITDFTVESHPRNAFRKQIKSEITMLAKRCRGIWCPFSTENSK